MENSDKILSGPEVFVPDVQMSVAECLIPRMKALPKDSIAQVDLETNESITSHDFLHRSTEIAEGLIDIGLKQGDVVIFIVTSNNIRSQSIALGIVLSGGVFAPIDPSFKHIELQHFFKEFQPKFIICEKEKSQEILISVQKTGIECKIVVLDATPDMKSEVFYKLSDITKKVDMESYVPRKVKDPKKDVAVISCSSGSTGLPKGVALPHYSILYNMLETETLNRQETNTHFFVTSPFFWISGTQLTLISSYFGQTRYNPKSTSTIDLLEGLQKAKPFFIVMSPSKLDGLVEHPDFKKYDLSSVKSIVSVGSPLIPSIADKIKKNWNGINILNFYGLSETCGGVIMGLVENDSTCVGRLLPEIKVKVTNTDTGKSLGPNETGELRIKTKRIMVGYFNNEKATKDAFDEEGWFRTGDLAYYDEKGLFYVVGRIKDVIDYQNYKISPAELEAFINGLPGVRDVVVVPVPHEVDGNHLRALVVKDSEADITAEQIINEVKENFTDRKHLRAGVRFVDALPRSEVGKLRRLEANKMAKE